MRIGGWSAFCGLSARFHFLVMSQLFARKPPMPIGSVVMAYSRKRQTTDWLAEKSLTNCPLLQINRRICNDWICWLSSFCLADNSSQIFIGKNWTFSFPDYKPKRPKYWKFVSDNLKTEFLTLLVVGWKLVYDSWRKKQINFLTLKHLKTIGDNTNMKRTFKILFFTLISMNLFGTAQIPDLII